MVLFIHQFGYININFVLFSVVSPSPSPPRATPSGKVVSYEDLTQPPGRFFRPPKLVVIMRGLPGSGKTHIARALKTTETEQGSEAPRILSLDDYFECDGVVSFQVASSLGGLVGL